MTDIWWDDEGCWYKAGPNAIGPFVSEEGARDAERLSRSVTVDQDDLHHTAARIVALNDIDMDDDERREAEDLGLELAEMVLESRAPNPEGD